MIVINKRLYRSLPRLTRMPSHSPSYKMAKQELNVQSNLSCVVVALWYYLGGQLLPSSGWKSRIELRKGP